MALSRISIRYFRFSRGFGAGLILALLSHSGWGGPGFHMGPPSQGLNPSTASANTSLTQTPESEPTEAQVEQLCPAGTNQYRKSLLITAFPQRLPDSSTNGALHDVEHRLPALLGEHLSHRRAISAPRQVALGLPNSRTQSSLELAQHARQLAEASKAQLVLSGEIIDMSMARPNDSFNPDIGSRTRNTLVRALKLDPKFDSRQREFAFEVTLRDALTGNTLLQRQYQTRGTWAATPRQNPGFGSPAFWKTHYGEQVAGLIESASKELAKEIQCQPLITTLDARPGTNRIMVHGGINQGLKAGDQLHLYKLVFRTVPGEYQLYRAHLLDAQAQLTLKELEAGYSSAVLPSNLQLHGRYIASTQTAPALRSGVAQ